MLQNLEEIDIDLNNFTSNTVLSESCLNEVKIDQILKFFDLDNQKLKKLSIILSFKEMKFINSFLSHIPNTLQILELQNLWAMPKELVKIIPTLINLERLVISLDVRSIVTGARELLVTMESKSA